MKPAGVFIAFTAFSLVFAAPNPRSIKYVVHEKRDGHSAAWTKRSLTERDALLPMRIGLTQRNLDTGHNLLMEISDPKSPKYGKHLSKDEVIELFAPSEESRKAVVEWLHNSGINPDKISISRDKQWIKFDATVEEAEELLQATYHVYEHGESGRINVACEKYHVPEYIKHHIDYITPGITLFHKSGPLASEVDKRIKKRRAQPEPETKPKQSNKRADTIGGGLVNILQPIITDLTWELQLLVTSLLNRLLQPPCSTINDNFLIPRCVKELYDIPSLAVTASVNSQNKLGIFQALGDRYSLSDLKRFNSQWTSISPTKSNPETRSIDGGQSAAVGSQKATSESNLDIQVSHHIIYPQGEVMFPTDDPPTQAMYIYGGFLNNFFDGIDADYCDPAEETLDPPYPNPDNAGQPGAYAGPKDCGTVQGTWVTSISYGGLENTLEFPASYQTRQCQEVMKRTMQGYTYVVATGDSGVAVNNYANDNNPNGCLRPEGETTGPGTIFNPNFPTNCPYFLGVGATQWNTATVPEVATSYFGSGGGFSNLHARPDYQATAVQNYLDSANLPFTSYDTFLDTNPDTLGANGGLFNRGGRAYPDVSALGWNHLITLNGKSVLYGGTSSAAPIWGAMLTRVNEELLKAGKPTIGFPHNVLYQNADQFNDITIGSNPGGCSTTGFPTGTGWDPVTGLGSISYPKLLQMFMDAAPSK
ncbi:Aorsin [Orbilia brochopaga]|nr:Aorsin [Drechslerella brochopaga]